MRQYSVEESVNIGNKVTGIVGILIGAVVAFAVGVVLFKLLWAWTVVDLFPTAVDQGLIIAELSWPAAIKAVTLVAVLSSTGALIAGRWRSI